MRALEIITHDDYSSGCGGDLFELEEGRDADEAFCSWFRTKYPQHKDWTDKQCMEESEIGWFDKSVGKLPPLTPATQPAARYEI